MSETSNPPAVDPGCPDCPRHDQPFIHDRDCPRFDTTSTYQFGPPWVALPKVDSAS